jgi:membrane associated rhomboid family serine protease
MFLHGGWMHLVGNMLFLWVFADNIEAVIGNMGFFFFYIFGGLVASAAHIAFNLGSQVPAVGASGAISAVMGAYLVMFPASKIKVLVVYFFRSFYMPALYFLGLWIGQQLINGFLSFVPSTAHTSGVAWWAHIGGFAFGVLVGFIVRSNIKKDPGKKPEFV